MMKKRTYSKMTICPSTVGVVSPILRGSVTGVAIKINEVTVEDYQPGFGDGTPGTDFKEIGFD